MQTIEDDARVQHRCSKSTMEANRNEKPDKITWSDKIQEKMQRRGMTLENRANDTKRFTRNKTIMEIVVEHAKEEEACETIAPTNQVQIRKKMILPCELVRFKGDMKTKEARHGEDKSCVLLKTLFENAPKLSKKSH